MTAEKLFVQKKYYQTLLRQETEFPARALGEAYYKEQKKDVPELTPIRFAQGELYFLYKDYEAAIFKWDSIRNELEPWAKKNIGDAYLELDQFSTAEEIYMSISNDSRTLQTEVGLKLFSLYLKDNRIKEATSKILEVTNTDPDYPGVAEMARLFFEERQDWSNAISLAVSESIRTKSPEWLDVVKQYCDEKVMSIFKPVFYTPFLTTLYSLDRIRFEKIVFKIWENYEDHPDFLDWLLEINTLLQEQQFPNNLSWKLLSQQYYKTFQLLMSGKYELGEIQTIIPLFLENWIRFTDVTYIYFSSSAAIAWNKMFPDTINETSIKISQEAISHISTKDSTKLVEPQQLFQSIVKWADNQELFVSNKLKWMMDTLQMKQTHRVLFTGSSKVGPSIIKGILPNESSLQLSSKVVMYSYEQEEQLFEVNSLETNKVHNLRELGSTDQYIDYKGPFELLKLTSSSIIAVPPYRGTVQERSAFVVNLHLVDSIIYVLNEENRLNDIELALLKQMKEQKNNLRIMFVLPIPKKIEEENGITYYMESLSKKLKELFPSTEVIPYVDSLPIEWASVITRLKDKGWQKTRSENELYFIKETLQYLIAKRADKEEKLIDAIQWNKEMLAKVSGASMQLGDFEVEAGEKLKRPYLKILEELTREVEEQIPVVLKSTADIINDNSDFRNIHLKLNEEMNDRMEEYLQNTILPKLYVSLQKWISTSMEELQQIHAYLEELAASFNGLYGVEKFSFQFDEQLLHDWRRDTGRMTSGVRLEEINIMLKYNPSQILLKGAGKLLSGFGQNKGIIKQKYKQYVEAEDYTDVAKQVSKQFFTPFHFFAMAIQRDVETFFEKPKEKLAEGAEEIISKMGQMEQILSVMQINPKAFEDPIKLFNIQYMQQHFLYEEEKREKQRV